MDEFILDINRVVDDVVASLKTSAADEDATSGRWAASKASQFKKTAHALYRREMAYPKAAATYSDSSAEPRGDDNVILAVYGHAPQPRYLFSSLPRRAKTPDNPSSRPLQEIGIPNGVSTIRVLPMGPSEKPARNLTLGELFPSPRNLPPLQPPKVPKHTTKSTVLSFYHPEPVEKSKYRTGAFSSANISVGQWLDYSNAAPASQTKTKQRERAQSLAGHKPSSTELEMSEMESLFRGAFSSFAPAKDDSAAMVSSSQVGRMWWQRIGHRTLQRMIDAELPDGEDEDAGLTEAPMEVDEAAVQTAIDEWDDSNVDPSLEGAMGQKSQDDKDTEDLLQDVSDLIETLSSYQRNRNLTLPTSQDRYSADPVNGDMLRNGSLAQQPSEEEMVTYRALKAQLSLVIQTLPPFAVARLDSDRLQELNVSTKLEVRVEEYRGVMEEDEPAARARQQAAALQAAATAPRPSSHRTPSVSSVPYGSHQYNAQYSGANRSPMPNVPYYQQTPTRAQQPPPIHQRPQAHMAPNAAPYTQQRPPQSQPYRPPNGYAYPQQQAPKAAFNNPYAASPTPSRLAQHPGYSPAQPANSTPYRYPHGYQAGAPQPYQHPQSIQPQVQQHHAPQGNYAPHANGATPVPARPMPQPHAYSPHALPRQSYPASSNAPYPNTHQRQYSSGAPSPALATGTPQDPGYKTVMDDHQMQRSMNNVNLRLAEQTSQQKALQQAQAERSRNLLSAAGGAPKPVGAPQKPVALSALGLGGSPRPAAPSHDMARLASGSHSSLSPSPKPQLAVPGHGRASPSLLNGVQQAPVRISPVPVPVPGMRASPVPTPTAEGGQ